MAEKRPGKRLPKLASGAEKYIRGGSQGVFRAISQGVSEGWAAFQPSDDHKAFEREVNGEDGTTTLRVELERGPDLIKVMRLEPGYIVDLYKRMGDDSDVFLCGCHLWLQKAGHPDQAAYVSLDDWARLLGYTPVTNGRGDKGGFRVSQRRAIQEGILRLSGMEYIASVSDPVTERGPRRATGGTDVVRKVRIVTEQVFMPEKRHYLGIEQGVEMEDGTEVFYDQDVVLDGFTFKPGEALRKYLWGAGGTLCSHFVRAFHYKDGTQSPEKKLARHFAFEFRRRVKPGTTDLLFTVDDLLGVAGLSKEPELPGREKKRLESALRKLQEDEIIGRSGSPGWGYADKHDDADLMQGSRMKPGWYQVWRTWGILIPVPDDLYQTYVSQPEAEVYIQQVLPLPEPVQRPREEAIGLSPEVLRDIRTAFGRSQRKWAQELGVSQGLISQCEKGITGISDALAQKVLSWREAQLTAQVAAGDQTAD